MMLLQESHHHPMPPLVEGVDSNQTQRQQQRLGILRRALQMLDAPFMGLDRQLPGAQTLEGEPSLETRLLQVAARHELSARQRTRHTQRARRTALQQALDAVEIDAEAGGID